jgi:hypothetical protein
MKLRAKNYDLRIVLGVSLLVALLLMVFETSKGLGTNLLTEIIGVAITVFVINKILERKERQRRIAIDQRILREIQSIVASYFSIWKHLTWKYIPEQKIRSTNDLLKIYPEVIHRARLDETFEMVSIHHPESWKLFFHNRTIKACFENYYGVLNEQIRTFINDFKMYIEPELLNALLNILESEYFRNIYMITQEENYKILIEIEQNPVLLESFISAQTPEHLMQFGELMSYSSQLRSTILKFSTEAADLYEVNKYFIHPTQMLKPVMTR